MIGPPEGFERRAEHPANGPSGSPNASLPINPFSETQLRNVPSMEA